MPIGVFDSGLGGLTVTKELMRHLPSEDIIYLGDTARVPYGTKSASLIKRYSLEGALFLLNKNVKMLVIACNTVSAIALKRLKELLRIPIIGVIEAGVIVACNETQNGRIGVIATPAVVKLKAYQNGITEFKPDAKVFSKATPLLVPLVEDGRVEDPLTEKALRNYLEPLVRQEIDTLVLGCTHYPVLKPLIKKMYNDQFRIVDSAETTAKFVRENLLKNDLIKTYGEGKIHCFVSDYPPSLKRVSKIFFGKKLDRIQKCIIDGEL